MVTVDPDPCPCGRILSCQSNPWTNDYVLSLPARGGGQAAVHPLHFALLTGHPDIREFEVRQDGLVIAFSSSPRYLASPTTAANDDLETWLGEAVARQLAQLGAPDPQVTVERRHELARSAGGKLKLVIEPSPPQIRSTPTRHKPANPAHECQGGRDYPLSRLGCLLGCSSSISLGT